MAMYKCFTERELTYEEYVSKPLVSCSHNELILMLDRSLKEESVYDIIRISKHYKERFGYELTIGDIDKMVKLIKGN